MNNEIEKRVLDEAYNILISDKTIREIAKESGVSKSTVHKDLQERLKYLDKAVYKKVSEVLKRHIEVRHIRGGESTRKKYQKLKKITKFPTNIS